MNADINMKLTMKIGIVIDKNKKMAIAMNISIIALQENMVVAAADKGHVHEVVKTSTKMLMRM